MKISSFFLSFLLLFSLSCRDEEMPETPAPIPSYGTVDAELTGTWIGIVNGSFGEADMTMTLNANANANAEGSTNLYCPINGKWGVKDTLFTLKGNDSCDGTSVTLNALRDLDSLKGTWSAASGNSGAFAVGKQ